MMIELQSVTKLYGTVIGVNDITLQLHDGVYGLLGPNGSGKTTLINLIMGQIQPTIGSVQLFGSDPWRRDFLLREVGLCPAYEISVPNVTGIEWVTYLTRLHGFGAAESRKRAVDALTFLAMDHAMNRAMREYSLGMRQRIKLAQAISHDPRLLILDEPFNGLDPIARHEMIEFLREWGRKGKSLILASHILHEVQAIQPSFLLISGGRLLASGSSDEVRSLLADSPNQFVIRCHSPRNLAANLVQHESVSQVRVDEKTGLIEVSSNSPARLLEDLPGMSIGLGNPITEFHTTEEPLKELFSSLMRFHRGENQPVVRIGR
jgi:ABC-2 type transport system ATP-binding protein